MWSKPSEYSELGSEYPTWIEAVQKAQVVFRKYLKNRQYLQQKWFLVLKLFYHWPG